MEESSLQNDELGGQSIMVILGVVALVGYFLRWNFRRAWYVLRTGDESPNWEKLGADYFIAPWEKRRFAQKKAAKILDLQEERRS